MTAGIEFDPAERDAIAAEMNISVLKRSDTAIKCVLKSANHVCLYQLGDDHQWRRLDVEGSLFIVERYLDHHNNPDGHMHRIVIINRKSLNNYTDDIIVGNKHLELADQMIMYSNSKQATIGIWFYQKAQADDIFDFLQRIVSGEKPRASPEAPRPKRTQKRPGKPADLSPDNSAEQSEATTGPVPDNSLERFFPNLKLTNGVAGHQVPESAKGTLFESQAVSAMSTSSNVPKTATAFKPTAEIDAAIITASESGFPEDAVAGSSATDANTLASQAMQVVTGRPKVEQKRKSGARPRPSPKSTSPHTSSQRLNAQSPSKSNGVTKTTSPPRSGPTSKPTSSTRANLGTKGSATTKSSALGKPHKQNVKSSPPSKRGPGGKRGQAVKGSSSNKYQVADKSGVTSGRAEKSNSTAIASSQFPALTRPKAVTGSKVSGPSDLAADTYSEETSIAAPSSVGVAAVSSSQNEGSVKASNASDKVAGVSAAECARPSTPNAPIEVAVPGAPRAKPVKGGVAASHGMHGFGIPTPVVREEEKVLHTMPMLPRHAETVPMPEQLFGMPQGFGPGFAGGLHPQMAMMMQQQHQMLLQQQYAAQQHQRQMQLQGGQMKTMEESANDLMRMLKVERSEKKSNAERVGESIAEAEKDGKLGSGGERLDKVSFRAVVQRMLTDRRLFDTIYEYYSRSHGAE